MSKRKNSDNTALQTLTAVLLVIIIVAALPALLKFAEQKLLTDGKDIETSARIVQENDRTYLHFIDVGQGDSCLITKNGFNILVDTGTNDSQEKLLSYLDTYGIKSIDLLILSHPHEDHIGGADAVIDNLDVKQVFLPDVSLETQTFTDLLDALEGKDISPEFVKSKDVFDIGKFKIEILAPNSEQYKEYNDYSIVARISNDDGKYMFTGDAEALSENEILQNFDKINLKSDILKIGHHGSSTSSTKKFVKAVSPAIGIVSCEKNNSYGHPHSETLRLFDNLAITVERTDLRSDIVIECKDRSFGIVSE